MSPSFEKIENNKVKISFSVSPERFEEGLEYSYHQNKTKVNIAGFRKGKVPRQIIEMRLGKEYLYSDAVEFVFSKAYEDVIKELNLAVVSHPSVDVLKVSKEEGVDFTAEVYIEPEVKLSDYKNFTYEYFDTTVTEEDINQEINEAREKNARIMTVTDRPSKNGDTVLIDYKGSVDGEYFEGGEAQDHELVLGSKTFIDNFEEQLENHVAGDEFTVNVKFPEEYHQESLSNKDAKFEVKLKEIREKQYPEIDDEFAQDVSDFDTLEEYKENLKVELGDLKIKQAEANRQTQVLDKLCANVEIDIPQVMIDAEVENSMKEMKSNLERSGLTYEMYLTYTNMTDRDYKATLEPGVVEQIKGRLALKEIAKQENIEVTEQDIEDEIVKLSETFRYPKEFVQNLVATGVQRDNLIVDIKVQKALKMIVDLATEEK